MTSPTNRYKAPFACMACRRSFKRPFEEGVSARPCPHCGGEAVLMSQKFKPPKKTDTKAWEIVRYLREHGFDYRSLYNPKTTVLVKYPTSMEEARSFVKKYRSQMTEMRKR